MHRANIVEYRYVNSYAMDRCCFNDTTTVHRARHATLTIAMRCVQPLCEASDTVGT